MSTGLRAGLSYEAREIACHSIETYAHNLKARSYDFLKIHCYRALFETVILKHYPTLRHCGLRSVKQREGLTFAEYCRSATKDMDHIVIPDEALHSPEIAESLLEWKRVVVFYTLRLMFAPLIESVILYDRCLWILDQLPDAHVLLKATFDPLVSPRNHIMIVEKAENKR